MHLNKMERQATNADHVDTASQPTTSIPGADADVRPGWRNRPRALWNALVAAIGLVMGIVPHVLHHVGLLGGTALVAGSGALPSLVPWGSWPQSPSCCACADGSRPDALQRSGC